jgi:aryl-alcohol dehydrogenase-like predicted oxidoreductase
MDYRRLGRTNLRVSVVGLGTGGASKLGQAHGLEQSAVTALVRRALELGINMIDTSPLYDDSEALLGVALAGVPRDSYLLATKIWPNRSGDLQTPAELRASVEGSLRRLGTDYLDVFYLHGLQPEQWGPVVEAWQPTLEQLKREGLIRFLGVTEAFSSDHEHATMRAILPLELVDVAMVGYNLLSPAPAMHVLPLAEANEVGMAVMCAVRGALLHPERIREIIQGWKREGLLAADAVPDDKPLGWLLGPWADTIHAAAYKFAAAHPAVSTVLVGTGRVEHLEANVAAILGPPLPPELVERAQRTFGPVSRNVNH